MFPKLLSPTKDGSQRKMNRIRRAKIRYLVRVLILGICSAWILVATKGNWIVWVTLAVLLITPGRIVGHYWRSLFRGLKCLHLGQYREANQHLTQFLGMLEERPWIKKLSWYGGLIYTQDVEAMALANLGVAHINLGELEAAEERLEASLKVDPEYPLLTTTLASFTGCKRRSRPPRQHSGGRWRLDTHRRPWIPLSSPPQKFTRTSRAAGPIATVRPFPNRATGLRSLECAS
jgi:tetratricopeptide (TPR) repeat protein